MPRTGRGDDRRGTSEAQQGKTSTATRAKLRGRPGRRVRVGDHRIVYAVEDGVLLVVVVTLGRRRDVYER